MPQGKPKVQQVVNETRPTSKINEMPNLLSFYEVETALRQKGGSLVSTFTIVPVPHLYILRYHNIIA